MTLRLILVCHAGTAAMRAGAFPADEPIDEAGATKAAAFARRLPRADRAWTSPALRARQTAAALGLDAAVEPALCDLDFGRWAGPDARRGRGGGAAGTGCLARRPGDGPRWRRGFFFAEGSGGRLARPASVSETDRLVTVTHAAVIRAAIIHAIEAPRRDPSAISTWHRCRSPSSPAPPAVGGSVRSTGGSDPWAVESDQPGNIR